MRPISGSSDELLLRRVETLPGIGQRAFQRLEKSKRESLLRFQKRQNSLRRVEIEAREKIVENYDNRRMMIIGGLIAVQLLLLVLQYFAK